MKIIVDCMSGDNAPLDIVLGAIEGAKLYDVDLLLVGNENIIRKIIREKKLSEDRIEIYHTKDASVTMEDPPSVVMKEKKDSSMGTALRLLAEGKGDALICAGNTGALFTGATLIARKIKGLRRAALGAIVPLKKPMLIVDAGANTDVTPDILCDFALMGKLYMERVMKINRPKVGLINNGAEETKGTELYHTTHAKLKELDMNFIGNVEGRDFPAGVCDILVTDGFTGNIVLKLCEGFGLFIKGILKDMFYKNTVTKVGAAFVSEPIKKLKKEMDYSEFGGAPFLGISRPVIKAHGSANAKSIRYCILQAKEYAASGIIKDFAHLAENPDYYRKTAAEKQENVNGEQKAVG